MQFISWGPNTGREPEPDVIACFLGRLLAPYLAQFDVSITESFSNSDRRNHGRREVLLTLLNLLFANLPQLIDLCSAPRHGSLYNLESPSQHRARCDCVRRRLRIHLDHADPRILGPAVVLAIFQIAQPCF